MEKSSNGKDRPLSDLCLPRSILTLFYFNNTQQLSPDENFPAMSFRQEQNAPE